MTLALTCLDLGLGSVCVFPYVLLSVVRLKIVWHVFHAFGHIPFHQRGPEILVKPQQAKPLGDAKARYGLTVVIAVADHSRVLRCGPLQGDTSAGYHENASA